jgi:ribose/xylose/arabinose/galactoside ABC-type transport system permease subunit
MNTSPAPVVSYETPPKPPGRSTLSNVLQAGARVAALAVIFIAFVAVVGRPFYSPGNVENILMQSAVFTMAGLGMTMVIITAGIDLAAGSIIALSMVVTAMILQDGGGVFLAVLGGTAAATFAGLVQGCLITGLNLVPFIVTLGGMQAIRGLTKGIADNQEISPPDNNWLYQVLMFPVQGKTFNWEIAPLGVWATLFAALFAAALLRYTKLGRHIYAVGSNEATARLCGVSVARTKIIVYTLAGLFAGLAGVLEFSKLNLGQPTGALSYELYVIAACVIGGTSLMGGVGTITGTVVGALIIGTLNAGAQQAGWPKWVQEVAIGAIIIAAVALDQLRARVRD